MSLLSFYRAPLLRLLHEGSRSNSKQMVTPKTWVNFRKGFVTQRRFFFGCCSLCAFAHTI